MDKLKIYTIKEVAAMCHCHHTSVLAHIHSGSLKACKVGRRWIISEDNLANFLELQHNLTVQAVAERSRKSCYTNAATLGTPTLQRQVARELDELLAQPTNKQPKNYTTNSNTNNGELTA